jgi:hypothetical protein
MSTCPTSSIINWRSPGRCKAITLSECIIEDTGSSVVLFLRDKVVPGAAGLLGCSLGTWLDLMKLGAGVLAISGGYEIMKETLWPPVEGDS